MVLVIALLDDKDRRNVDEALALVSWNIFLALTYVALLSAFFVILIAGIERNLLRSIRHRCQNALL